MQGEQNRKTFVWMWQGIAGKRYYIVFLLYPSTSIQMFCLVLFTPCIILLVFFICSYHFPAQPGSSLPLQIKYLPGYKKDHTIYAHTICIAYP